MLQGWVNTIVTQNNLPTNSSCIVVLNPLNITNTLAQAQNWAGYHQRANVPYIFSYVFGQNLTIDDRQNAYAQILSHEIAEMTVDPLANVVNPEVCDACAGNCRNLWNDFFDNDNRFIDGSQNVPPPFGYAFFINSIIKPQAYDPSTECALPGSNLRDVCVYRALTLNWSFAGNTAGFGHGINDGRPFWIGNFSRSNRAQVLFYYPGDDNWWLGSHDGNQLQWSFAGNTAGFGHGINDGRPFWIGNFSRSNRAQVLFYYPGDDNWWLGSHDGNQLQWSFAGNTAGFGHGINDGRPFWIGDFNGDARADVLFYYPGDDNWWLGSHDGNQLQWSFAGNTAGFGHGINDGRPFWIGNFSRSNRAQVLFYYPGDDNWWLGSHDGNQLQWSFAGNTAGFGHGINDGRPFWIGDFNGDARADVLFYYPGDDNWWLGSHDGNQLQWSFAGNTAGFGHGINDGRPFWIGDFNGDARADVLFYYPGDDNWWLGSHDGNQLQWSLAGNTAGFGHGINDGRPFWIGDFNGDARADVLFYYPGDDNWWLGSHNFD